MKKGFLIAIAVALTFVLLFSACTLVVSHEREGLTRAAEAGSSMARVLVVGANFWARYFLFCLIAVAALFQLGRRLLMEAGYW